LRKEWLAALILGLAVGAFAAAGFFIGGKSSNQAAITEAPELPVTRNSDSPDLSNGLEILSPANFGVATESAVTIAGKTNKESLLLVSSQTQQEFLPFPREQGSFEAEVELRPGINRVSVAAFKKGESPEKKEITIIYSTETDATEAYVGTVTDLTDSAIQIRTLSGEIGLASINENTTYANIIKKPRDINLADLGIGDYVIALGRVNGAKTLESSHVLISSAEEESQTLVQGIVNVFSSTDFIITDNTGKDWSIDATGRVKGSALVEGELVPSRIGDIEEGQEIVVTGNFDEETKELIAESIFVF